MDIHEIRGMVWCNAVSHHVSLGRETLHVLPIEPNVLLRMCTSTCVHVGVHAKQQILLYN